MVPPGRRISSSGVGTNEALFGFISQRGPCTRGQRGSFASDRYAPLTKGPLGGLALTSDNKASEKPKKGAAAQSKNRDMGSALRSVYNNTVEEAVPQDLLSLLGKLD